VHAIIGLAILFLAMEIVLLPLLHNQGRGVFSASKIDKVRDE